MIDKANTPDEKVDVVDENDRVIGKSTKGRVNSNPSLWHREITVLILDNENKVLTQQRSKNKKNMPLAWTLSVAGHVPSGKSYEEAAHMELKEELGFDTRLVDYEKGIYKQPHETQVVTSFIGRLPKNVAITIDTNEVEAYKFIDNEELEKMVISEKFEKDSLNDFRKYFRGEYDKFVDEL